MGTRMRAPRPRRRPPSTTGELRGGGSRERRQRWQDSSGGKGGRTPQEGCIKQLLRSKPTCPPCCRSLSIHHTHTGPVRERTISIKTCLRGKILDGQGPTARGLWCPCAACTSESPRKHSDLVHSLHSIPDQMHRGCQYAHCDHAQSHEGSARHPSRIHMSRSGPWRTAVLRGLWSPGGHQSRHNITKAREMMVPG